MQRISDFRLKGFADGSREHMGGPNLLKPYFAVEARQLIRERAGLSERLVVDRFSVEGGGPAEA
jgi:hypothetical protein